jgi:hypothetical protein
VSLSCVCIDAGGLICQVASQREEREKGRKSGMLSVVKGIVARLLLTFDSEFIILST